MLVILEGCKTSEKEIAVHAALSAATEQISVLTLMLIQTSQL